MEKTVCRHLCRPVKNVPPLLGCLWADMSAGCWLHILNFIPRRADLRLPGRAEGKKKKNIYIYIYTHTHTDTYIYICIYFRFFSLEVIIKYWVLFPVAASFLLKSRKELGFPGGSVVKSPPDKAGDRGSIPGPARSTCLGATKPCAMTTEPVSRAQELQQEKPLHWEAGAPAGEWPPVSTTRRKPGQQRRPAQPKINK